MLTKMWLIRDIDVFNKQGLKYTQHTFEDSLYLRLISGSKQIANTVSFIVASTMPQEDEGRKHDSNAFSADR